LQNQREIKTLLIIYRLTFLTFLVAIFFIIKTRDYVYISFLVVAYFIRDFIFPIRKLNIDQNTFTIIRIYLGGLFDKVTIIQKSNIIEVVNIEIGLPDDSTVRTEYDFILPISFNSSNKMFEMYLVKYLDSRNQEKKVKLSLTRTEADALL
jgi:hypothetical protein